MATTMNMKQLQETSKQIAKAVDGGDPASTVLSLMSPLLKWTATEDALRQSKIGVSISKFRQNKDPKVAELAGKLINKWKADVSAQKKRAAGTSSPAPPAAAAKANSAAVNGKASATSSPAPPAVKKETRKSTIDPEKRNSKADGIETAVTGNPTRDGCVKLMYDGLAFMSDEDPDDILKVARQIEIAAYNKYQPETSSQYKQKLRSLFMNLKIKTNSTLRKDVYNGNISPEKFVVMSGDELKSAEKRAEDAAIEKENMRVAMTAQEEKAISTTMQCGKCKERKVAYSQAQTRSADEPMTTFCECMNCGNRWKFS